MADKKSKPLPSCASCDIELMNRRCIQKNGKASKGCPTISWKEVFKKADDRYNDPDNLEFARQASRQEGDGYNNHIDVKTGKLTTNPTKTRIVEICEFAQKMDYKRIGLAFCGGLVQEAAVVEEVLKNQGFEVVSAICKAGCVPKGRINVKKEEFIYPDLDKIIPEASETMCNPIFQAELLNAAKADFNVLLGLCVGHDSLFLKNAEAYTTVLAVKDRVTGHNPLAAIYLSSFYYSKIKA